MVIGNDAHNADLLFAVVRDIAAMTRLLRWSGTLQGQVTAKDVLW